MQEYMLRLIKRDFRLEILQCGVRCSKSANSAISSAAAVRLGWSVDEFHSARACRANVSFHATQDWGIVTCMIDARPGMSAKTRSSRHCQLRRAIYIQLFRGGRVVSRHVRTLLPSVTYSYHPLLSSLKSLAPSSLSLPFVLRRVGRYILVVTRTTAQPGRAAEKRRYGDARASSGVLVCFHASWWSKMFRKTHEWHDTHEFSHHENTEKEESIYLVKVAKTADKATLADFDFGRTVFPVWCNKLSSTAASKRKKNSSFKAFKK